MAARTKQATTATTSRTTTTRRKPIEDEVEDTSSNQEVEPEGDGEDEEEELNEDGKVPTPPIRRAIPARPRKYQPQVKTTIVNQSVYDPEDDLLVPHSGTIDEFGNHHFDESPIAGGMIINNAGEVVNFEDKEIDPSTGTKTRRAKVIDPERYINRTESDV